MAKGKLDKSFVYKRFRRDLVDRYGAEKAAAIWADANAGLQELMATHPDAEKNDLSFVFPAVAIYRSIEQHAPGEALEVTRAYGTKTGLRFRDIFRKVTALPGFPALMWKKMPTIAKKMSDGYEFEDLVVTDHRCSLNVTGCPMYDGAKALGCPEAAQLICCMDKEYMTGFRGVRYTRTKSLAEGDDCCDYLLEDSR
ncbi:L-2-amino-thiazoline-4-carboxylic acid hydrolase [Olsenella uli]|uniref:L-2-amino-thiazoline-4-carboxylic acid hydrolase n=1 Tax=Olsenella uli TaxID=133926 RepID=UPI00044E207D|nr:L-2-amino-thiazoline-4-carboxylic acid hydrolase [Olsenella uli]EUB32192.1 L-2-amino-thiazoline-4-carboxylic acid hydrolase [Olsenella uli MSTE5]